MVDVVGILLTFGIPSAITGLVLWFFKRYLDKREAKRADEEKKEKALRDEREQNTEKLMLIIMQTSRATNVLAEATAKAVQRIPDAHCNGDMDTALRRAAEIQKEEQQFLIDQGIKRIFDN